MAWDNSLYTDPLDVDEGHRGALSSTFSVGWIFYTKNDTAYFKFYDFRDSLRITLELYNDEQTNVSPFDLVTFEMPGNSHPTIWQYTGFPTRGDGNPKDKFRCNIICEKLSNDSHSCANYAILTPR